MKCNCRHKILKIQKVLTAIILIFSAVPQRAAAENASACFMVTPSGRTVELAKLCNDTNTTKTSSQSRVFRIPIKRRFGRTPVIDVTFNNQKTFEMIVDTGANSTLITQAMANTLQIKTTSRMQAQTADGTQVELPIGQVKSIAAGGIVARNLNVAIAPKASIGLLGYDFFSNYDIKILEKEVEFHQR